MKPIRMPTRYGTVALLAAALLPAAGQTYLIDFGGANTTGHAAAPNDPVNYWNNVGTAIGGNPSGVLPNLVSSGNVTSTLSLVMLSRFNAANENGTQSSVNWPINATRDSLFGNTESFNGLVNIFPRFKLTGLDAASKYAFTFYASRTGVSDNREAGYTVTGSNTGYTTLNASVNIENTATVTDITPDETGAITIALAPTANNNNGNHFTYLGILKVVVTPPQTPLAFTVQPVSQRVIQLRPATFTAAVSGSPPYNVQWYENGTPMNNENQFTLTLPSVALWMNGYTYSVSVSNLAYGVLSSNAVLSVLSDTNPPTLLQAVSYDGSSIQLTFNETLDWLTVVDPSNYTVNSGAVQVWSATLNPDGRSVALTLSDTVTGTFTVVVNNVRDEAGNPIAPNTSLTGTVVPIEEQDLLFDFGASTIMTGFGPAPDDPSNYWNNVTTTIGSSDSGTLLNALTAHNAASPVGLLMVSRFTGANENGTLFSTVFPARATQDSLYGNTEEFSGLSNIYPRFKLTGLNPARQYTLTFFASRTSVADNRETGYTVTGANTGFTALNAANNLNTTAQVAPISPTAGGEIEVALAPTANNNNANHFTYLGVLKVSPYVPPPQFLPAVIQGGQIKLQWTGTGQLLRAPSVLGPWSPVLPTPASPYSETLVPGENRFYRLQQ
jgi:hypothetical protein